MPTSILKTDDEALLTTGMSRNESAFLFMYLRLTNNRTEIYEEYIKTFGDSKNKTLVTNEMKRLNRMSDEKGVKYITLAKTASWWRPEPSKDDQGYENYLKATACREARVRHDKFMKKDLSIEASPADGTG